MSNNLKKNLLNTLDNLLDEFNQSIGGANNNQLNQQNQQIGGRKYSQKEVDTMLMSSLQNIMALYQKSLADKQLIKEQIQKITAQKLSSNKSVQVKLIDVKKIFPSQLR